MRVHIVHHSADYDGLFSGAVCKYWIEKSGHECVLHGWDFGDPVIEIDNATVYVVDLPVTCVKTNENSMVIWIDHHKSSIESTDPDIMGYRIDGVAACRLAWQWFSQSLGSYDQSQLEEICGIDAYRNHEVVEPWSLTLAGEYDVWDKRDPMAEQFQFGLTAGGYKTVESLVSTFFSVEGENRDMYVGPTCDAGKAAMQWQREFASDVCKNRGYMVELWGLKFWTLASAHTRNSMWFPDGSVPEDADALCCYRIPGDGTISVSLYHKPGREDLDLSVFATQMRGGGHRGACGFSLTLGQAITMELLR